MMLLTRAAWSEALDRRVAVSTPATVSQLKTSCLSATNGKAARIAARMLARFSSVVVVSRRRPDDVDVVLEEAEGLLKLEVELRLMLRLNVISATQLLPGLSGGGGLGGDIGGDGPSGGGGRKPPGGAGDSGGGVEGGRKGGGGDTGIGGEVGGGVEGGGGGVGGGGGGGIGGVTAVGVPTANVEDSAPVAVARSKPRFAVPAARLCCAVAATLESPESVMETVPAYSVTTGCVTTISDSEMASSLARMIKSTVGAFRDESTVSSFVIVYETDVPRRLRVAVTVHATVQEGATQ